MIFFIVSPWPGIELYAFVLSILEWVGWNGNNAFFEQGSSILSRGIRQDVLGGVFPLILSYYIFLTNFKSKRCIASVIHALSLQGGFAQRIFGDEGKCTYRSFET